MEKLNWRNFACAAVLLVASAGCVEVGLPAHGDTTHGTPVPIFGMHDDPALEDQQEQTTTSNEPDEGMRYPPAKTIARTHRDAPTSDDGDDAALENPVRMTTESLRFGRVAYEKTCATCHGRFGEGDGPVAAAFDREDVAVPSIANKRVQNFSDERIYRTISDGVGNMWPYRNQLKPMERWAVVNYLRALQRARFPEPWDLNQ